MGADDVCTGDLVGVARRRNIVSFGEDDDGEVYILAVSNATPTTTDGVVYQLVDPARYVGVVFMNYIILNLHHATILGEKVQSDVEMSEICEQYMYINICVLQSIYVYVCTIIISCHKLHHCYFILTSCILVTDISKGVHMCSVLMCA